MGAFGSRKVRVAVVAVALPLAFGIAIACTTTLTGGIAIVTGPDDGFKQDAMPVRLVTQLINYDSSATTVAEASLLNESGGFTLPPLPGDAVDIIQITGFDDAGQAVVSGTSIPVALDQLSGITLNLFVQRTGQFSRLPATDGSAAAVFSWTAEAGGGGGLSKTPLMTTLYSRYLLVADGTGKSTNTQAYDTLTWQLLPQPPLLEIPPLSLAYVDQYTGVDAASDVVTSALLTIGSGNQANWLDLNNQVDGQSFYEASLPSTVVALGDSFSQVAGGQTVVSSQGNTYIVGPTRSKAMGGPTAAILRISPSGVFSWATLRYAREGAAVAFANSNEGMGIFVFGGNLPTDGSAPMSGVEFVSDSLAGQITPNPTGVLPSDTTTGAGAVAFDSDNPALTTVLVVGGVTASGKSGSTRFYSANGLFPGDGGVGVDAGDGGVVTWPELPGTLVTAQVFAISGAAAGYSAVVIGNDENGLTHAYLMTPSSVRALAFKESRYNSRAGLLANGSLAVVGGDSGTIESFIPGPPPPKG